MSALISVSSVRYGSGIRCRTSVRIRPLSARGCWHGLLKPEAEPVRGALTRDNARFFTRLTLASPAGARPGRLCGGSVLRVTLAASATCQASPALADLPELQVSIPAERLNWWRSLVLACAARASSASRRECSARYCRGELSSDYRCGIRRELGFRDRREKADAG